MEGNPGASATTSSLPNSPGAIDPEVLFQTNSEWILLNKTLENLKTQLDQAKQDAETLQKQKEEALQNVPSFIKRLKNNEIIFPTLQTIVRVPDLDLSKYIKRTSRRGSSKYEQNLEFLVAKIQELHKKSSLIPPVLLSNMISISSSPVTPATAITMPIKEKFFDIVGYPMRPNTAPGIPYSRTETPTSLSGRATPSCASFDSSTNVGEGSVVSGSTTTWPATLSVQSQATTQQQPRPQRVHRVPLTDNDLVAAHYNLPWSEEEKRRLEELLLIYPEEGVNSRRYAKIAQALGTRTASQVSNRIHKLNAKRARQAKREAELARQQSNKLLKTIKKDGKAILEEDEMEFEVNDEIKATEDYREYMKLKQQLAEIKAATMDHPGFKCDGCGMEPIIGARYHCNDCKTPFPEVDLCRSCMTSGVTTGQHKASHKLTLITGNHGIDTEV